MSVSVSEERGDEGVVGEGCGGKGVWWERGGWR